MKKLTDYKDDDAIELWCDLLDPLSAILTDAEIRKVVTSGKPKIEIAKEVLRLHKKEAVEIMLRIDDTPIDGLNIIMRLMALLSDIGQNDEIKGFFGYAEQAQTDSASSGLPMENTEAQGE
jgi:hypothetical protein